MDICEGSKNEYVTDKSQERHWQPGLYTPKGVEEDIVWKRPNDHGVNGKSWEMSLA